MSDSRDPGHEKTKEGLKSIGIVLMLVGGLLSVVGFISFFSAFSSGEPPGAFWAAFIGIPLFGLGTKLAGFGFLGEISRYTSGEVTPVIKDSVEHVKGIGAVTCSSCGARNDVKAAFCGSCGSPLGRKCQECGTINDAESRFCDSCGKGLVVSQR